MPCGEATTSSEVFVRTGGFEVKVNARCIGQHVPIGETAGRAQAETGEAMARGLVGGAVRQLDVGEGELEDDCVPTRSTVNGCDAPSVSSGTAGR